MLPMGTSRIASRQFLRELAAKCTAVRTATKVNKSAIWDITGRS